MDAGSNLQGNEFFLYAACAAGALVVLAVILYLLPIGKIKMPVMVVSNLGCLAAGFALGVLTLSLFGYHWDKPVQPGRGAGGALAPPTGMPMGGGMPMMGGGGPGGPGGPGGGPGGQRGPNAKAQLANLVTKLELLTRAPLKIDLDEEKRGKIREHLNGLLEAAELSTEDAQKRLDGLLLVLKSDHATLEAAGFRIPGAGGGGGPPPSPPPNPFAEGERSQALKNLQERLGKGGASN
jgi:hypothetical protein